MKTASLTPVIDPVINLYKMANLRPVLDIKIDIKITK
jgi:hypothetical protein